MSSVTLFDDSTASVHAEWHKDRAPTVTRLWDNGPPVVTCYRTRDLAIAAAKRFARQWHKANPAYRREFPDYPPEDFPPLPPGFEDASWHNCACPCLVSDRHEMTIWIDYPDEEDRENKGFPRFTVQHQRDGVETGEWSESTDEWSDVLRIIERHKPR